MRRNRATTKETASASNRSVYQPSTPQMLNQNSNSCSNDTMCSSLSNNNTTTPASSSAAAAAALNSTNSLIAQDELKIRNLLKELQTNVKHCQEERDASEPNIAAILKTHEKVKKEEKRKISMFLFRT